MNADRIKNYVAQHDNDRDVRPEIVSDGEIVVLRYENRLLLYNRTTGDAFEVKPDMEVGVTVHAL